MTFSAQQPLNDWVQMLDTIYGHTQNYAKSGYEISSHLLEVAGAFGKYLLKKRQPERAIEFLPKVFAWTVALLVKTKGPDANAQEILLAKFPGVCPYCCKSPCECWRKDKPLLDESLVRKIRFTQGRQQRTTLNDLQLMFRSIYEESWKVTGAKDLDEAYAAIRTLHSRLVEELSELAEALRFHHLHPSNFDNELADVWAWWFALVSSLNRVQGRDEPYLAEDLMWEAYPGYCRACELELCDCRPGPVRMLLSKPSLGDLGSIDELTQASNSRRFDQDVGAFTEGLLPLVFPVSYAAVHVGGYRKAARSVGDEMMVFLASVLRRRIRARDKLYRVNDDIFVVLLTDYSLEEAQGYLKRLTAAAKQGPFQFEISFAVKECEQREKMKETAGAVLREVRGI